MTLTARKTHGPEEEDTDLLDLLQEDEEEAGQVRQTTQMTPNNSTSTNSNNIPAKYHDKPVKYSAYYNNFNKPCSSSDCSVLLRIPELLCFYFTYFLLHNPLIGKIAVLSLLGFLIYTLLHLNGSTQTIGVIKYDFSTIKSQYDFQLGKVDHYCIQGGNDCACPDPLSPSKRPHIAWERAVKRHIAMIETEPEDPDVVFLGQSLVEVLNGRINGMDKSSSTEYFAKVHAYFDSHFGGTGQGTDSNVKALAMGLTGDSASNVLWRLMNGELPDDFNPPIWWLVLGMEDIGRYGCSEEITVMGVLRIVEEIKSKRPDAKIVVNSLLPMIKMRMKEADDEKEFVDAERDHGKGPRRPKKEFFKEDKNENNGKNVHAHRMLLKDQKQHHRNHGNKTVTDEQKRARIERLQEKKKEVLLKKYEKDVKKDKFNPHMKDVKTYKKKGRHPERGIPMWSAIHEINKELHKFCQRTPHVTFFDATSIFASPGDRGDHILLSDMISPRGHPTVKGFKAWMDAMQQQASEWKKKIDHVKEMHNGDPNQWAMNSKSYYEEIAVGDDAYGKKWFAPDEHDDEEEEEEEKDQEVANEEEEEEDQEEAKEEKKLDQKEAKEEKKQEEMKEDKEER